MKRCRRLAGDYTVGWICALPIELAAAQEMLDEEDEEDESLAQDSSDDNLYTLGRIGDHNVVLACLPAGQTRPQSAATVAARMRSKFASIHFGLMVGIGGGVPNIESDIRLGDVVISQPYQQYGGVVQYDLGKTEADGRNTRTGSLNTPPAVLLNAVSKLRALHYRGQSSLTTYISTFNRLEIFNRDTAGPDILFEAAYNHIGGATCEQCSKEKEIKRNPRIGQDVMIHFGTIASGNQVMKDGITRDRISSKLGGVMCFEMEAAGLMNNFPCLVIRGICDYADSHKNKKWQPYAAATAAACAKEILLVIPASKVATIRPTNEAAMYEMLWSAIDHLSLDQFLPMLSVLDQDQHISKIPCLDPGHPVFYWVFKNIDFKKWSFTKGSQMLWLSGHPDRNIDQVSSYMVGQAKNTALRADHLVLYFFCSSAVGRRASVADFAHTLLQQIVCSSPVDKKTSIIRTFLHSLLKQTFERGADCDWKERGFSNKRPQFENIKNLLNAPANCLLTALCAVIDYEKWQYLSIIIDGLESFEYTGEDFDFIRGVRAFVTHLQRRTSKIKVLLTSQPEIIVILDGLIRIEYDKERQECINSLHFDNTRYGQISKEHEGSFEWLWIHKQYTKWSAPDVSSVLYIQGKPGSGKSTITKYFSNHLQEREKAARSAIVIRFFYSYREGEIQRTHYNLLRSILCDILRQDEAFFYHHFQAEYRVQYHRQPHINWAYASLKKVLKSLQDYSLARRLYLIIDAVDESEEKDRRDILNLLFELCANIKNYVMKIFVASRPVGQLELRQFQNFIRLQEETKSDIYSFAHSFLLGLNLTHVLAQATEYIVKNAQGVFLWVKLVAEELLTREEEGYAEEEIFDFLKRLPTELEDFYKHMFDRMNENKDNLLYAVKMFQFVLFARRPLTVDELLHALIIPANPDVEFTALDESFQKRIPTERRIISCGGNFLEIKPYHGNRTVQVMHHTVREFFLNGNGHLANSKFKMRAKDAHTCISITCIRYLMLYAANTTVVWRPPDIKSWNSEHLKGYAQYIDKMPLMNYALRHLKHHINGSRQDVDTQGIINQFTDKLTCNPNVNLLESWVSSHWNKDLLSREQLAAAQDFRDNVFLTTARNGFSAAAEVLLSARVNVNREFNQGWTALHFAGIEGHEAVVRLLVVEGKADVNARNRDGWTVLHLTADKGHEAVVRLLIVEGMADVNAKNVDGWTALHMASWRGHEAVVRLLVVEGKADATLPVDRHGDGWTALRLAVDKEYEAVIRLLVVEGRVDVNAKDKYGWTVLHLAADKGHEAVVILLVVEGKADVNARNRDGWTALHMAADKGHQAVVRLLLVEGMADVNLHSSVYDGRTALQLAANKGHEEVVKLLVVEGKADVNLHSNVYDGRTALQLAADKGHEAVVRLLVVEGKADVNLENWDKWTALHLAANRGHEAVVRLLVVELKADVNARSKDGWTALHLAAYKKHEAVIRLLVVEGKMNVNTRNYRLSPAPLNRFSGNHAGHPP